MTKRAIIGFIILFTSIAAFIVSYKIYQDKLNKALESYDRSNIEAVDGVLKSIERKTVFRRKHNKKELLFHNVCIDNYKIVSICVGSKDTTGYKLNDIVTLYTDGTYYGYTEEFVITSDSDLGIFSILFVIEWILMFVSLIVIYSTAASNVRRIMEYAWIVLAVGIVLLGIFGLILKILNVT